MNVKLVATNGCEHIVHTEAQLQSFLAAGWVKAEDKPQPKKPATKKVTSAKAKA